MGQSVWILACLPLLAAAQPPQSGALVRGVLLERDAPADSGEFSVRAAGSEVFRYRFDRKTYVESDAQTIDVARLKPGERVEVVSDKMPGAALRYALTIHVLPAPGPPRPLSAGRLRAYPSSADRPVQTGNLVFSGMVFRISGSRLVLHTRAKGDQTILLRQDTRYLDDGKIVDAAALKPNTLVFVRAGKTLFDEIEGYQVVWGRILQP